MRETWHSGVFELLDPEILDDGVGEQFPAHVLDVGIAGAVGKVELDQLARTHVVHAGKAEPLERVVDRFALGVENPGLESDEDPRFHARFLTVCCSVAPMVTRWGRGKLYPLFTLRADNERRRSVLHRQ